MRSVYHYFKDWNNIQHTYNQILDPKEVDYYKLEKQVIGKIFEVDLETYLQLCAISRGKDKSKWIEDYKSVDREKVDQIKYAMLHGVKFKPIDVSVASEWPGQEGRHRAVALTELGYKTFPIVVIKDWSQKEIRKELGIPNQYYYDKKQLFDAKTKHKVLSLDHIHSLHGVKQRIQRFIEKEE